ncbi:Dickkopf-related protein 2 [Larimichthys crocea]|nr:Dickkopf-related protein 2 [Larimichthys crocea]
MTHHQSLLVLCVALVLWVCSRGGDARVRLNSIRTVILREGHALPVNRSAWEPSLDLTLYQCMSDLECSEGSYCHAPTKGPAHSRCQTCRRRKRRCHRDGMCCPGNRCSNNICVPDVDTFVSQRIPDSDGGMSPLSKKKGWRKRGRVDVKAVSSKGRGSLPALVRLFRRSVLRPALLDSHLQAGVAGGTGLHATPPEGEPRTGAVPALPLRGRTELPDAAGARPDAIIVFGVAASSSNNVQVRRVLVSPLVPAHLAAGVVLKVGGGGEDETPRVPEKLKNHLEAKTFLFLPMTEPEGNERRRPRRTSETETSTPVRTCDRPQYLMLISFLSGRIHTHSAGRETLCASVSC